MKKKTAGKITILLLPIIILVGYAVFSRPDTSIEALIDPRTRLRAYHTMWASQDGVREFEHYEPLLKYSNFKSRQNAILLYKIPQKGAPDSPLYLTFRDQDRFGAFPTPPWKSWKRAKVYSNWKQWFAESRHSVSAPELAERTPVRMSDKPSYIISLHDSDGTILDDKTPRPFRGNNVISEGEIIYDINNDGWMERITLRNFGFRDSKIGATAVIVTRINKTTDVIFRVLVNVDNPKSDPVLAKSQWGFHCRDTDGDGSMELEIGEIAGAAIHIHPAITFFWDKNADTFVTKSPPIGDHYRVLESDSKKSWEQLQELLDSGKLKYPLSE